MRRSSPNVSACCARNTQGARSQPSSDTIHEPSKRDTLMSVKDPVCGMEIKPEDAVARIKHEGRDYYFCSESCEEEFRENPEDYAESD